MFETRNRKAEKIMCLSELSNNQNCEVVSIPEGDMRSRLLRFGLYEGQSIKCISKLPGGTIVIELNRQEIAIGGKLAKMITVSSN